MTPLSARDGLKAWTLRGASLVEQEIRAHPRLFAAFYRTVTSSPRLRHLAGRVKDRVRLTDGAPAPVTSLPDDPVVAARRQQAVSVLLGLDPRDVP